MRLAISTPHCPYSKTKGNRKIPHPSQLLHLQLPECPHEHQSERAANMQHLRIQEEFNALIDLVNLNGLE